MVISMCGIVVAVFPHLNKLSMINHYSWVCRQCSSTSISLRTRCSRLRSGSFRRPMTTKRIISSNKKLQQMEDMVEDLVFLFLDIPNSVQVYRWWWWWFWNPTRKCFTHDLQFFPRTARHPPSQHCRVALWLAIFPFLLLHLPGDSMEKTHHFLF